MKNKSYICIISLILLIVNLFLGCNPNLPDTQSGNKLSNKIEVLNYYKVKDSLIRFHVIANSDTVEDQQLKLKVRDAILDYLYPYLNKSKSLEETRNILNNNKEEVLKIANKVIQENNYKYDVKVQLSKENFPEKSYGNLILPQGRYESFRVIIGSGQGHNWWCVMFPPLCFVDESKAVVEYDKTKNKFSDNMNEKNNKQIKKDKKTNDENNTNKVSNKKIEYKLKVLEIFQGL